VLGLKLPTDPRWANLAEISLEDILTDHAYCEQKATSTCISLIALYPDRIDLVQKLAPVVAEEWGHFRMVLKEMEKRNLTLGKQRKDEYVNTMIQFQRKGGNLGDRLVDKLLLCALIEARSCERFRLLSLHLEDEGLKKFYHTFMVSEAGHYRLFIDLANQYGDPDHVKVRWQEFLDREAEVLKGLELRGDRMH